MPGGKKHEFIATVGGGTCKSKMHVLGQGLASEGWRCGLGASCARKPGSPGWKENTRLIWQNGGEVPRKRREKPGRGTPDTQIQVPAPPSLAG